MTVKVKEELSHICQIIAETVDAEKYTCLAPMPTAPRVGIVTMICVFSSLIWHCVLQTRSNEFAAPCSWSRTRRWM